jgi:hypothetical protein
VLVEAKGSSRIDDDDDDEENVVVVDGGIGDDPDF